MAGAERTDARGARRRGHSPDAGRPAQRHAIRTTHARHRNSRRANRPNVRDLRQAIWPRRAALVLRFLAISTAPNSGRTTATLLRIACERRGARSEDARKKTSRGDLEIPPIVVICRQKQAVNKRVDSLPDSNTRSKHQAEQWLTDRRRPLASTRASTGLLIRCVGKPAAKIRSFIWP